MDRDRRRTGRTTRMIAMMLSEALSTQYERVFVYSATHIQKVLLIRQTISALQGLGIENFSFNKMTSVIRLGGLPYIPETSIVFLVDGMMDDDQFRGIPDDRMIFFYDHFVFDDQQQKRLASAPKNQFKLWKSLFNVKKTKEVNNEQVVTKSYKKKID